MQVHLCGVRGSRPAPGRRFAGVGGHTSCVAIAADDELPTLVLDAGTGLSNLSTLFGATAFGGTIVLGHLHWDHVMGIPFFPAGDRPGSRVHVLVPEQGLDPLEVLTRMMSPPLFPITPTELRGDWTFGAYGEGKFDAGAFSVVAREIPHKGGRTMGLRVSDGRSVVAYLSDHAPHMLGPGDDGLGELHPAALELAMGADLLIHDAQYTSDELTSRASWGHAAAPYCLTLARRCGVGKVVLFHHDPTRTDDEVWAMRERLARACADDPTAPVVDVAVEGSMLQL